MLYSPYSDEFLVNNSDGYPWRLDRTANIPFDMRTY
jgi:hypothetical protein